MPDIWLYTAVMGDNTSTPSGFQGRGRGHLALDETDRRIVAALVADGRLSVRALAEQVHISRASAYARLQRLERDAVITGYSAVVDADRIGLSTSAYVSISIEQNSWKKVAQALRTLPSVVTVALVGAEFDAIVQVRARDNQELRDLVLEDIQAIPGIKGTRTWLIFEELDGSGPKLD